MTAIAKFYPDRKHPLALMWRLLPYKLTECTIVMSQEELLP